MKKIGLLGGTFDPVHFGHLQLAEAAMTECELDEILFIVAASPPHKAPSDLLPFEQRYNMVELACSDFPYFSCSDIEAKLPFPSYTYDTLKVMLQKNPDVDFHFIIGEDAFIEIKSWKKYRDVLALTSFILSCRVPVSPVSVDSFLKELGYECFDGSWCHDKYKKITILKNTPQEISSTTIRKSCSTDVLKTLVPENVMQFIERYGLYR